MMDQDALIEALEAAGRKAFEPTSTDRSEGQRELGAIISSAGTLRLIAALNRLIKPDRVPRWLRVHLMDVLVLLPQRPDGVRATLEFLFSVHPSSTVTNSEAADPQKQGANITMEAMKMAASILATPPTGVAPEAWYPGVAPQLFALLDGQHGADLVKVAAYIIGFGILGRKQFGAPGTPGWKAFAEPMLAAVNPSLASQGQATRATSALNAGPDEVVDLQREVIAVKPNELYLGLNRLTALLHSHPNPGLSGRLLSPLFLPLWTLSSWPNADQACQDRFCRPASTLLKIYLKISGSAEKYAQLVKNLLYDGSRDPNKLQWRFELIGNSEIQITRLRGDLANAPINLDWASLESKSAAFNDLLKDAALNSDISKLFLMLFQKSFNNSKPDSGIKFIASDEQEEDPTGRLLESKVLQDMLSKNQDKLVSDSRGMLDVASRVLADFRVSPENSDSAAAALSILNIVVTAPSFDKSKVDTNVLESVETALRDISRANQPDVSQTAHNLLLLLKYRDEIEDPSERPSAPADRQVEDRKTWNLALSYITQADSPPPVRSEGLNLISGLIKASSPILDIQGVLVLLSSLLAEDDDYINVQTMKMFVQVSEKHPKSVVKELLEHYVDANEEAKVDTRLRFGEAILKVVERLGDTFSGEIATQVGESLLSIAGRRGYRPKTEARQVKEEKLRQRRHKDAEDAWGGDIPDISPDETEQDKARNEVLAQILQGWESKRGSEDIRIRTSALSVFSVGMETNVAGMGPSLVQAAVDLSVNILTMEPELEQAILRRAAIILVLNFVRALADAREHGRSLGFGLADASREDIVRILRYVAGTDNDGLVQQHAGDVLESLENWRMMALMPVVEPVGGGLARIVGLDLKDSGLSGLHVRPKIEEVE